MLKIFVSKKVIMSGMILGISLWLRGTAACQTYYVQPGDSLYLIAAKYGTTTAALQAANRLTSTAIYAGQALKIVPSGSSVTGSSSTYITRSGDSLYLIAQRYGISVTALKQANNLTGNSLLTGQILKIPAAGTGQTATAAVTGAATHVVKSGDSIYFIAQKYGITTDALLQANYLSASAVLYPGQKLTIPAVATNSKNGNSGGIVYGNRVISQNDLEVFARLVSAEASGESFEGQVAVAATILHRLTDPRYPNTISEIAYQVVDGYYQYSPVLDGRINEPAAPSAYRAIQQAIAGWDPSNGANGFYNPAKTTSQWVRSQKVTTTIGDHVFFSY